MCFAPQRRALFRHRGPDLTSKRASRHNGVHCFDMATSKSGPTLVCFVHFQLRNVLRATTACTFSTSQLLKVIRPWCVLYIFNFQMCFAPQRRATFHLSSPQITPHPPLKRAYFSILRSHGKTQCFATFLPFRAFASSFF